MRLSPAIIERTRFGQPPARPMTNKQRYDAFRTKLDGARQEFNQFFQGGRTATHRK